MDDLDDLLDEIEKSFDKSVSLKTNSKMSSKRSSLEEDIDEILKNTEIETSETKQNSKKPMKSSNERIKCSKIFLGGSTSQTGLFVFGSNKICDNLRCISCDFKVLQFTDYCWDETTDYLFLRNNMPDYHRLKNKLNKCLGTRAYSCQCSWKNVSIKTNINTISNLKWVCGRHKT